MAVGICANSALTSHSWLSARTRQSKHARESKENAKRQNRTRCRKSQFIFKSSKSKSTQGPKTHQSHRQEEEREGREGARVCVVIANQCAMAATDKGSLSNASFMILAWLSMKPWMLPWGGCGLMGGMHMWCLAGALGGWHNHTDIRDCFTTNRLTESGGRCWESKSSR